MLDKVIRVFVSSTFKDMRQERDKLHSAEVQGSLRTLCESYGFQFQLIDLRWGVSAEAGWDQRTEQLCLEEIHRCREVSPRPNFIALVGQRYGWRPLPQTLTQSDWKLVCRVAGDDKSLLEDWYRPDANNVPFVHRLRPRLVGKERQRDFWGPIEQKLHAVLMRCFERYPDRVSDAIAQADKSLTEKEIEHGAENARQRNWQAFAYFRDIDGKSREELDEPFVDRDDDGNLVDQRSSAKLASLRSRLGANETVTTRSYSARARGDLVDEAYLEALSKQVCEDLSTAIQKQLEDFRSRDPLAREIDKHLDFAEARLCNFVPRLSDEQRAVRYVRSPTRRNPLLIAASSGAGKTAMLARIQQVLGRRLPDHVIVTRFIGASGESASLRPMVRSIHDQVAREIGSEPLDARFTDEPMRLLGETLRMGTRERPVAILLDALDQLASDDHARSLNWLPIKLPEHAKLIATVMSAGPDGENSDVYKAAAKRLPRPAIAPLNPMNVEDLVRAFSRWLESFGRTVSKTQINAVATAIETCPRPLFVRVLAELAKRWDASHDPGALPSDIQEAIAVVLADLERKARHGKSIVAATLAKLAASRAGLTEPELVDLLSRDAVVLEEFKENSRHEYLDVAYGLPPIVWSRLLLDLRLFLGQSSAVGVSLLDFYHRQLAFAVEERYAKPIAQAASDLADYFESQPAMIERNSTRTPNVRRAFELVWQLRSIGSDTASRRLQSLLTDQPFVEGKARSELERDLLEDYFRHVDDHNLGQLVRFLADYLLTASTGAERLAPEVIQSYLAYLTKISDDDRERPNLYVALLEEIVDHDLDAEAPKAARRRVLRCKISLGEQRRRKAEFEEARALLTVLDETDAALEEKDLATGWYEKAYIEYLEDNYPRAIEYFDRSITAAEEADDAVGAMIPYGPRQWAAYFIDPRPETLRASIDREQDVLRVLRRHELTDPRAQRWVRNTLAHLANLHYYLDDVEGMRSYVIELRNNPWIRDYETSQGSYLREQHEARFLCAQRRYKRAAEVWRAMFAENKTKRDQQAAAWLMYDYGVAVELSGRKMLAAQIYFDGLDTLAKGAANAFWHNRIRERLSGLSERVRDQARAADDYESLLGDPTK